MGRRATLIFPLALSLLTRFVLLSSTKTNPSSLYTADSSIYIWHIALVSGSRDGLCWLIRPLMVQCEKCLWLVDWLPRNLVQMVMVSTWWRGFSYLSLGFDFSSFFILKEGCPMKGDWVVWLKFGLTDLQTITQLYTMFFALSASKSNVACSGYASPLHRKINLRMWRDMGSVASYPEHMNSRKGSSSCEVIQVYHLLRTWY